MFPVLYCEQVLFLYETQEKSVYDKCYFFKKDEHFNIVEKKLLRIDINSFKSNIQTVVDFCFDFV